MNELYLLDTATASLVGQGDVALTRQLEAAREVYVPEVVYGELFFGAYRYTRLHNAVKFLDLYERFAADKRYTLIVGHLDTARIYGPSALKWRRRASPSSQTTSGSPRSPGSTTSSC